MFAAASNDTTLDRSSESTGFCPRCGYDQRGVISWQDSCPLEGTCSECGLDFRWRDLLNPPFTRPQWMIEYVKPHRQLLRAAISTMACCLFKPTRFWNDLQMHHVPRWRRVAALPLFVGVLLYFVFCGSLAARAHEYAVSTTPFAGATAYPPWAAAAQALVLPYSRTPMLSLQPGQTFWTGWFPPASLARLYRFPLNPSSHWRSMRLSFESPGTTSEMVLWSVAMAICSPACFAALPISRRLAKVRWRHILRVAVYASVILVLPLGVDIVSQIHGSPLGVPLVVVRRLVFLATIVWLVAWWAIATRHYLRMPHALVVGVAVVTMSLIIPAFVLAGWDMLTLWLD